MDGGSKCYFSCCGRVLQPARILAVVQRFVGALQLLSRGLRAELSLCAQHGSIAFIAAGSLACALACALACSPSQHYSTSTPIDVRTFFGTPGLILPSATLRYKV